MEKSKDGTRMTLEYHLTGGGGSRFPPPFTEDHHSDCRCYRKSRCEQAHTEGSGRRDAVRGPDIWIHAVRSGSPKQSDSLHDR